MKRALLVLAIGCGGSSAPKPTDAECSAYAKKTAALMYVGFERGSHGMGKWIEQDFSDAIYLPLAIYCQKKIPPEHARCVAAATTADEADRCPLDGDLNAETQATLVALIKTASNVADKPATADECRRAATAMLPQLRAGAIGAAMPSEAQIAGLCISDKWTADFVRCTAERGADCKAKPNVQPGVTKLVADAQLK